MGTRHPNPRLAKIHRNYTVDEIASRKATYRDNLVRNHAGKAGLRGKINAKCIECIYDPWSEGTWRLQVENCTSWACPLYEVRAKTTDKIEKEEVFDYQKGLTA